MNLLPEQLKGKTLTQEQLTKLDFTTTDNHHWTRELYLSDATGLVKFLPVITVEDNKAVSLTIANEEALKEVPSLVVDIAVKRIIGALEEE